MSKSHVLLIGTADYVDEFDLEFFKVMTREKWEKLKIEVQEKLDGLSEEVEVSFGTNESVFIKDFDDWMRNIEVKEINENEATLLLKLFGRCHFGTGNNYFDVLAYIDDRED